ncbi:MAG: HAD-IIIA family hydrolase [Desulfobacterales bacterium]|nr:HAD-IIIA family hydrolase [Desulfobacterales bacterium]
MSITPDRLKSIKLLLLDVDGVLTDGSIIYNDQGEETKVFNAKDGLGLRLLMEAGIKVGIVTGRRSNALNHRCKNLGIKIIFEGVSDKSAVLNRIMGETGTGPEEIAFVGDDLPDLPLMRAAGFSIAVHDAHETILKQADLITSANGGRGAVREVCELILKARGLWENALESFGNAGNKK